MSVIQSNHVSGGKEALDNSSYNASLLKELKEKITASGMGGRPDVVQRHKERGKLLVRDKGRRSPI